MNWIRLNLSNLFSMLTAICIGLILVILINLQSTNAQRLEENSQVLKTQQQILDNLKAAVTDLKADNQRQTRFIECILALHGANVPIDADVQAQCTKMASSVDVQDVIKSQATTPPSIPMQPAQNTISGPMSPPSSPTPTPAPKPRPPISQFVCQTISVLGLCKP